MARVRVACSLQPLCQRQWGPACVQPLDPQKSPSLCPAPFVQRRQPSVASSVWRPHSAACNISVPLATCSVVASSVGQTSKARHGLYVTSPGSQKHVGPRAGHPLHCAARGWWVAQPHTQAARSQDPTHNDLCRTRWLSQQGHTPAHYGASGRPGGLAGAPRGGIIE